MIDTWKVVRKNVSFVSIANVCQARILITPCTFMAHTPDQETLAETIVFCLSRVLRRPYAACLTHAAELA